MTRRSRRKGKEKWQSSFARRTNMIGCSYESYPCLLTDWTAWSDSGVYYVEREPSASLTGAFCLASLRVSMYFCCLGSKGGSTNANVE